MFSSFFVLFFCHHHFSSFSEGDFHPDMSRKAPKGKPTPAPVILQLSQHPGDFWLRRSPKPLTCCRGRISWLWPHNPCSSAPRCWCASSPGPLSGTRWWTACRQSEWAASQTSSFSLVPVRQLNVGEATFVRREPSAFLGGQLLSANHGLSIVVAPQTKRRPGKAEKLKGKPCPPITCTSDHSCKHCYSFHPKTWHVSEDEKSIFIVHEMCHRTVSVSTGFKKKKKG